MSDSGGAGLVVLLWALGCVSLYLVVRAAVRAGIEDAWKRRARAAAPEKDATTS